MTAMPTFSDAPQSQPLSQPESQPEEPPAKPKRKRRTKAEMAAFRAAQREEQLAKAINSTDKQLFSESGIERVYTTTEAAEFFDKTNQWLYYCEREGIWTKKDGTPILPRRVGGTATGNRVFTLDIIEEILRSTYRRTNVDAEDLMRILRRIEIARAGGEWREAEGWQKVKMSANRSRWFPKDKVEKIGGEWVLRKGK